jgi:hypothetical protein
MVVSLSAGLPLFLENKWFNEDERETVTGEERGVVIFKKKTKTKRKEM